MVAWQLCQERKHGRYPELPAQQHYKNGSSASMEALPAWKHCQHDSYARNASIASTATLPARQQCQHGSIASKTASKIAIPEWQLWQHGQHGSIASTAALPAQRNCQNGSYAIIANFLFFMQLNNLEIILYMQPCSRVRPEFCFSLLYKRCHYQSL